MHHFSVFPNIDLVPKFRFESNFRQIMWAGRVEVKVRREWVRALVDDLSSRFTLARAWALQKIPQHINFHFHKHESDPAKLSVMVMLFVGCSCCDYVQNINFTRYIKHITMRDQGAVILLHPTLRIGLSVGSSVRLFFTENYCIKDTCMHQNQWPRV